VSNHLEDLKNSEHPWGAFLYARYKAMIWMREKMGYDNVTIANKMCMDEMQVRLILMTAEETEFLEMDIPSDEDLQEQLLKLHETTHLQVADELHGLDWFSFFDDNEIKELGNK
jgi:hypothetical protein